MYNMGIKMRCQGSPDVPQHPNMAVCVSSECFCISLWLNIEIPILGRKNWLFFFLCKEDELKDECSFKFHHSISQKVKLNIGVQDAGREYNRCETHCQFCSSSASYLEQGTCHL